MTHTNSNQGNVNHDSYPNNQNQNQNYNQYNLNQNSNFPGTVTVTKGSNIVSGSNTSFKTTFKVGETIRINDEALVIVSIESDTALTTSALAASASNSHYSK